ncbi:MAG: NADH-quinone oxidoreductase subunit E [Sphingobacteriales bacterium]|nr:NADH-quinone oxidoreductase subunit E [Sphingobacteriales bacterium]
MNESILLLFALLVPVAGMITIPFIPHPFRARLSFIIVCLVAMVTTVPAIKALGGEEIDSLFDNSLLAGNWSFHVDRLSAWFILIINLTCINGAFYGMGYMKQYDAQRANLSLHWVLFLLFQASMLWVCMAQNGLVFLIVWELMSISSFLLVLFDHQNKTTLQAGINYLVQMHIGVLFLAAAFIWVYYSEGSLEFSAIERFFSTHSNFWLFLLFFTGFGIKAGFIPLHSWLPQAHPAAPSHISGVMSGVIVKLGIYGIFRMVFFLKQDYILIGEIVVILSVLTGLYGILNASVHRDIKKMLAYCTIENIGIIGLGIGLGLLGMGSGNGLLVVLGFTGALLHTLNHSLFKSLLFFTAGAVYQQTHTRDMEKLGGLIHRMPQSAVFFLVGAMAIGGLPPFNGFVSEFLIYAGILLGIKSIGIASNTLMISSLAGLAFIGGVSLLTFTKSFGTVFLGTPRSPLPQEPKEVSRGMRLPQYFIILIMLSVGLLPSFYFSVTGSIVSAFVPATAGGSFSVPAALTNSLSSIGKFSLIFLALPVLIYFIRKRFTRRHRVATGPTWGCGYTAPTAGMQYTGKSFSKSLGKLMNFMLLEKKKYREIRTNEVFPPERKYTSHYNDFFVTRVFDGLVDRLLYSMNYFQFIQNGKIQMYILYGIFFIVLVFLGTALKLI